MGLFTDFLLLREEEDYSDIDPSILKQFRSMADNPANKNLAAMQLPALVKNYRDRQAGKHKQLGRVDMRSQTDKQKAKPSTQASTTSTAPTPAPTPRPRSVSQRRQNVVRPARQAAGDTGRVDQPLDLGGTGGTGTRPPTGGSGGSGRSDDWFSGNYVPKGAETAQKENLTLYMLYMAHKKGLRMSPTEANNYRQALQRKYPNLNPNHLKSSIEHVAGFDRWAAENDIDTRNYRYERFDESQPDIPEEHLTNHYARIHDLIKNNPNFTADSRRDMFGGTETDLYDPSDATLTRADRENDIFNDYRKILDRDNYRQDLMNEGRSEEEVQNLLGDITDEDLNDPQVLLQKIGDLHRHHMENGDMLPLSLKDTGGDKAEMTPFNEKFDSEGARTELLNLLGPITLGMNMSDRRWSPNQGQKGPFDKNNIEFDYAMKTLEQYADESGEDKEDVMRNLLGFQVRQIGDKDEAKRKDFLFEPSEYKGRSSRGGLKAMKARPGKPGVQTLADQMAKMAGVPEGENETYMMPFTYGDKAYGVEAPSKPNQGTVGKLRRIIDKQNRGERLTKKERETLEDPTQSYDILDQQDQYDQWERDRDQYLEDPDRDPDKVTGFAPFSEDQKAYWSSIMEELAEYHNDPRNMVTDAEGNQKRKFETDIHEGIQVGKRRFAPGQFRGFIDTLSELDEMKSRPDFNVDQLKDIFPQARQSGFDKRLRKQIRAALYRLRLGHNYMNAHKKADGSLEEALGDISLRALKKSQGPENPIFPHMKLGQKGDFNPKEFGIEQRRFRGMTILEFLNI